MVGSWCSEVQSYGVLGSWDVGWSRLGQGSRNNGGKDLCGDFSSVSNGPGRGNFTSIV